MTEKQAFAIWGVLIDTLVKCQECGDRSGLLDMTIGPDGAILCQECNALDPPIVPTVEAMIRAEADVDMLRAALVGEDETP